jgi:nitrate reductase (cytochrome), electron transfer subunit
MTPRDPRRTGTPQRVVLIASASAAMLVLVFALDSALAKREAEPSQPRVTTTTTPLDPIDREAQVFRTRPGDLALDAGAERRTAAHPRTLTTYRSLRAFPGAPPRIPHGLTPEEFRTTRCNTCHERGGYSVRFEAYAPVTPHPEFTDCLQCHVGTAATVGIALPGPEPDAVCRQCHAFGATEASLALLDWRPATWPATNPRAVVGMPPVIPHDLQLRGNCLACHMGPGAVAEIRTRHAERANCLQCHVAVEEDEAVFARYAGESAGHSGDLR